jgi:hypothetical protein
MIGDVINHLLADTRITAHVGTRIFPVHLNQDEALPGIMVTINDVEANPTKTAASSDDFVELDVTIYARSAKDAFTIAELVRSSLDNFSGTMGSTTVLGIRFERLNMNHFAGDDVYLCGLEFQAHQRR